MAKEILFYTVPIAEEAQLQRVMDEFEAQTNHHVNIQSVPWELYRQEFTNIALHRIPADVGVAGTPATSDLIAMNALRPFTQAEISQLGGADAFLPARWRAGMRPEGEDVWAIPLVTDLRMLYYHRDLLAKAGLDEAGAFANPQQFEQTIQQIQRAGVEFPWTLATDNYGILHRAVSWIWAYGGDLFTPDGKWATFHEEAALEGLRAYFRLVPRSSPAAAGLSGQDMLRAGRAAVVLEDAFGMYADLPAEIGCAAMPGGSYVGGSDLIVWNHTRNESAALALVRYLSSPEVTAQFLPAAGRLSSGSSQYLPVRMRQLQDLSATASPMAKPIIQSVLSGRTFPCVPMIGLVEDRLGFALASIQRDVLANPKTNVEQLLQQRVVALGRRMNMSLGSVP